MRHGVRLLTLVLGTTLACTTLAGAQTHTHGAGDTPPSPPPLFDNLGVYQRPIHTNVPAARKYFEQGLNLLYGFNHDEAIRAFQEAVRLDPSCAIAWWGLAVANGPHINNPSLDPDHAKAAYEAVQKALTLGKQTAPVERDLIEAQAKRYASDPNAERRPLDQAYADAMRAAYARHPEDVDVGALFAESLMDLRPWDLWTKDGQPQPGTEEIVTVLEKVLARAPNHPGANHFYIHTVEASLKPERAVAAADRLRTLVPGAGHLVHMPGHIYQRVGRYADAAEANRKAIAMDREYVARSPNQGFYLMYKAHNFQFLAAATMMDGRAAECVQAGRDMTAQLPPELVVQMAEMVDGVWSMPVFTLVRFGRWDDVMKEPAPDPKLKSSTAVWHWARGLAFAAGGKLDDAAREKAGVEQILGTLDEKAMFGFNPARAMVKLGALVLAGDIAARRGQTDEALRQLREAVALEDASNYDEPRDWPIPARHFLGSVLLAAGRAEEAEAVYREDLKRNPENGWALFGLAQCLRKRGAPEAADVEARFHKAWARADVTLTSSRF